jgi:hypothetical protein
MRTSYKTIKRDHLVIGRSSARAVVSLARRAYLLSTRKNKQDQAILQKTGNNEQTDFSAQSPNYCEQGDNEQATFAMQSLSSSENSDSEDIITNSDSDHNDDHHDGPNVSVRV